MATCPAPLPTEGGGERNCGVPVGVATEPSWEWRRRGKGEEVGRRREGGEKEEGRGREGGGKEEMKKRRGGGGEEGRTK